MRQFFLVFLMLVMLGGAFSTQAAGVVGTGTPASCTEAALDAALAGGGTINFNCGAAAHTISLSGPKDISANTTIDGGGRIALDGGGFTQLFYVYTGISLELRAITIQNGRSIDGGAIKNDGGTLRLVDAIFLRSESVQPEPFSASGNGGAIYNAGGTVDIFGGAFRGNSAARWGGAIFTTGGEVRINGTQFLGNRVAATGDDGGAIAGGNGSLGGLPGSTLSILNARFGLNSAPLSGGAIFSSNGGSLSTTGTNFVWNVANVGGAIRITAPDTEAPTTEGLTIFRSRFLTNVARYFGGAVDSGVPTTINESEFSTNSARGGGALQLFGRRGATITHTTFSRNRATYNYGGAILNYSADVRLLNSLLVGNYARQNGGAIYNDSTLYRTGFTLRIANTTISGNRAFAAGGGLYSRLTTLDTWVRFATIAYNRAPEGANVWIPSSGSIRMTSSIIAHPAGGASCNRGIDDDNWTIQYPEDSCGSPITSNPMIEPLADNGGLTWTHAIPAASPAVDGSLCPSLAEGIETDQRDFPRPGSGTSGAYACDVGAYEYQDVESASFPLVQATAAPTLPPVPTQVTVNCQPFRLTSPRDGLPNGGITVYWDAAPGAAVYRVIVYNENNAAVASADAPANTTSLNLDVSEGAVGGGFTFTLEVQALLNGQAVCRDAASMLRSAPPAQQQCGNGIQEPGENPNNCPNGY